MRPDAGKFLFDIQEAISRINKFLEGKAFEDYSTDLLLRSGVERQLEIAGEALSQLAREDPLTASLIPEHRRIIAFRNILIHGYARIDDRVVWDLIQAKVPALSAAIATLLSGA